MTSKRKKKISAPGDAKDKEVGSKPPPEFGKDLSLGMKSSFINALPQIEEGEVTYHVLDDLLYLGKKPLYKRQDPWILAEKLKSKFENDIEKLQSNIKAVVLIAHKDVVTKGNKPKVRKARRHENRTGGATRDWASLERISMFRQQHILDSDSIAFTGVLIDGQTIITCGHACEEIEESIKEYVAIKGYYFTEGGKKKFTQEIEHIEIKELLYCNYIKNSGEIGNNNVCDLAILKLEGTFTEKQVAELSEDPIIAGEEVYMLGFGWGQPMKISLDGMTHYDQGRSIRCKLIARPGNSGSPVFDARTHKLVGIHHGTIPSIEEAATEETLSKFTGHYGSIFTKIWKKDNDPNMLPFYEIFSHT